MVTLRVLANGYGPESRNIQKRQTTTITQWAGKVRTQGKYQCGLSGKPALGMTPFSSRYPVVVLRCLPVSELKPNLKVSVLRWETT